MPVGAGTNALKNTALYCADVCQHLGIENLGNSAINIGFRFWVPSEQYFESVYNTNLAVYKALGEVGISIPFPQRDMHLIQS